MARHVGGGCSGHHHGGSRASLRTALLVAAGILGVEAAGGWLAGSLALLSDAGHMLTDVLSLGIAWFAVTLAERPATPQKTYGYHRAGILAALFNAATLLVVAAAILAGAVERLRRPVPVDGGLMMGVAALGLAGNLYVGARLGRDAGDVNVRAAWLHVVGDAAASAGVLAGGAVLAVTGWTWVDPAIGLAIALLVARGAWRIVAETLHVLMEGTPPGIRVGEVAEAIEAVEGVRSAHHIHVWSLGNGRNAMSGHIVVGDTSLSQAQAVMSRVSAMLAERFQIEHSTLQAESAEVPCPQGDCGEKHPGPDAVRGEPAAGRGVPRMARR